MSEENKAIARGAIDELFVGGHLDRVGEFISPDHVGHDPAGPEDTHGVEAARERIEAYRTAFPDLQVTIEDQLAEGDRVCTRWTARGTHDGDLMGMSPTGRQVTIEGLSIDRFEGGKIVETWDNWDTMGMMQQLGAIPQAQPAA